MIVPIMSKYYQKLVDECGYEPKVFPQIMLSKNVCDMLNDQTPEDRGLLFTAISDYHWYNKEPSDLPDRLMGIFVSMKYPEHCNVRAYIVKCRTKSQNRKNPKDYPGTVVADIDMDVE